MDMLIIWSAIIAGGCIMALLGRQKYLVFNNSTNTMSITTYYNREKPESIYAPSWCSLFYRCKISRP